ncbi:MAG: hypothetical protein P0Y66_00110 [Candidatus Kaistia colombiensis]|nr:MAG: hypothetical protein P0Y66_00110 [Kaistia sp.]
MRPPADVEAAYAEKVRFRARRQAAVSPLRASGRSPRMAIAFRLHHECRPAGRPAAYRRTGRRGIGLFRTELQFMVASSLPRMERADCALSAVLDAAATGR